MVEFSTGVIEFDFGSEFCKGNRGIIDLKKTSCGVGMHFGNFRVYSVKIGNLKKGFGCLPENAGCIPSAVVMRTADGMHPAFSGRHTKHF